MARSIRPERSYVRDDLDALRERGLQLLEPVLHAGDDVQRVLAVSHDDDPAHGVAEAVEIRDAAADLGPDLDPRDVAQEHRRTAGPGLDDDLLEVGDAARVPAAADHVLAARELHQAAAHLVVALADRGDHLVERQVVRGEPGGIDRDLVLLDEPADGRHFGHAGNGLQRVAHGPVLVGSELVRVVRARAIHQRVLEHPADAGRVGAEFGLDALGQPRLDLREVLDDARPGPVEVGAVLEDHVHVREAEVGVPANRLDLRRAEQRAGDRVGHLVLDDVGRPVPPREDDHLRVGQVRQRVEPDLAQHVDGSHDGGRGREDHQQAIARRELDDAGNHVSAPAALAAAPRAALRRRDSESSRKLADEATSSPA